MPSLRKRANSNSLLYRIRDDEGREVQRSVCLGPCETLADARQHFERVIADAEASIDAKARKHSQAGQAAARLDVH